MKSTTTMQHQGDSTVLLHTRVALRRTLFNRVFAALYTCTVLALLYHHFSNLLHSTTIASLSMLLADVVFAFMWATHQAFRMSPIRREQFPKNLSKVVKDESEFPKLDVFICTADPYKEPPMGVVNTALSVMAYDYPMEKLSVYVSDDGGSQLTLFAFMEAAKFAQCWLPYCRKNNIVDRCPEVYFGSDPANWFPGIDKIKMMYESMKIRVENVVERGSICDNYITDEQTLEAFSKWTVEFMRQDHPTVVQVLLERDKDKDVAGHTMPNLIYVSREKRRATPHNFKAGALNVLLRVSATMTNAPIVLTLDCDMYSNDPMTPLRAMCYHLDPSMDSKLAFVQFPQIFQGINKNDIYGAEYKCVAQINPAGFDGLLGPPYMGTGSFFRRRVFFGGPSSLVAPDIPELSPHYLVSRPIQCEDVLALAHHVAGCNFEAQTKWGSEVGFRYGSLVEDFYTGYRVHCQGWKSIFCNPNRAAFFGNAPMNFDDLLNQLKRWCMGLIHVACCKYSPITLGFRSLNPLQALCYTHYACWPIWCIPITIYAFLPQLALINSFPIFPQVSDKWFFLYVSLFIGAYGQDFLDFILAGGTVQRWWNNQRLWLIRGLSSFPFALLECLLDSLGISTFGFNVTSKVVDSEQSKRYDKGIFEFGVSSPMFLPVTMAAIINLLAFLRGITSVFSNGRSEDLFMQMFIAGFGVVNSWPIYEAMVLRTDKGKMPLKITLTSTALAWVLYLTSSFAF